MASPWSERPEPSTCPLARRPARRKCSSIDFAARQFWKKLTPPDVAGSRRERVAMTPTARSYASPCQRCRTRLRSSTTSPVAELRPLSWLGGRSDVFAAGSPSRSLRDPRPDRRGRDGRGLPGEGPAARARRRDQGPAGVVLGRPGPPAPLRAGGAGRGSPEPPEHHGRLRHRLVRRRAVRRPELLEGETLRAELAGERLTPRKAIDYATQIARGLAAAHEKGDRPSRPEAREPLRHEGRPRQDPRLRPRQADAAGGWRAVDQPADRDPRHRARRRPRDARLHVARSRCAANPRMPVRTSSRSGRSSTRCSRGNAPSRATRRRTRCRRSSARTRRTSPPRTRTSRPSSNASSGTVSRRNPSRDFTPLTTSRSRSRRSRGPRRRPRSPEPARGPGVSRWLPSAQSPPRGPRRGGLLPRPPRAAGKPRRRRSAADVPPRNDPLALASRPTARPIVYSAAWEGTPPEIFYRRAPASANPSALGVPGGNVPMFRDRRARWSRSEGGHSSFTPAGTLAQVPLAGGAPRADRRRHRLGRLVARRNRASRSSATSRGRVPARVPDRKDRSTRNSGASVIRGSRPTASGSPFRPSVTGDDGGSSPSSTSTARSDPAATRGRAARASPGTRDGKRDPGSRPRTRGPTGPSAPCRSRGKERRMLARSRPADPSRHRSRTEGARSRDDRARALIGLARRREAGTRPVLARLFDPSRTCRADGRRPDRRDRRGRRLAVLRLYPQDRRLRRRSARRAGRRRVLARRQVGLAVLVDGPKPARRCSRRGPGEPPDPRRLRASRGASGSARRKTRSSSCGARPGEAAAALPAATSRRRKAAADRRPRHRALPQSPSLRTAAPVAVERRRQGLPLSDRRPRQPRRGRSPAYEAGQWPAGWTGDGRHLFRPTSGCPGASIAWTWRPDKRESRGGS